MIPFLIGLAVVMGLTLLALLYYAMLESLYPEKLRTDEVFLVTTQDLWQIRMCRYRKGRTGGQPVLLVHGANANQHNFTTPPGGNLVDYLVERGYDCWTIDLRGTRSSKAPFERDRSQVTTDDYLNDDIPTAIRLIQQETGYARVHYIGHSLGGMLLYAYALKHGTGALATGITLGSPLGFEGMPPRRSPMMIKLAGLFPAFSGSLIRSLIPLSRLFRLSTPVFPTNMRNLAANMNSGHFFRMIEDPLPGVLDDLSRWMHLPGWRMDKGDLNVLDGLSTLDFPLFALYAPQDPFVTVEKAREFLDALPSADKRMLVCAKDQGFKQDYNHCDLAFAKEGNREVFAPIARWLETHPVRERMPIQEPDVPTGYQQPLDASQRADILSGESFAHLSDAPDVEEEEGTAKTPTAKKKSGARKKKPAARKKPSTRKKSSTARASQAEAKPTARKQTAKRQAPSRTKDGGPNLAAASEALSALGPAPRRGAEHSAPKIQVKNSTAPKAGRASGDTVETPQSVLKALSDASGVLDNLKDKNK